MVLEWGSVELLLEEMNTEVKKTMEGKLKKIALISGVLFVIIVLFLPYVR